MAENADVNIEITADASSVTEEAAKAAKALNSMGKDAGVAGDKLDNALDGAGATAKKATPKVKELSTATSGLKDSAGETASVMGKLKSAIGLVSPEAEAMLDVAQRAADGVEGLAQASGAAGGGLSALAPFAVGAGLALGAAATAAVVVANAYDKATEASRTLTADTKRTTEAALDAAAAVNTMRKSWDQFESSQQSISIQLAVAEGNLDSFEAAAISRNETLKEQSRASIGARGLEVASIEALISATQAEIDAFNGSFTEQAKLIAQRDKAIAQLPAAEQALADERAQLDLSLATSNELADALRRKAEAQDKDTESTKKAAVAAADFSAQITKLDQDFMRLGETAGETKYRETIDSLDELEDKLREAGQLNADILQEIAALRSEALTVYTDELDIVELKKIAIEEAELERAQELADAEQLILDKAAKKESARAKALAADIQKSRGDAFASIAADADRLLTHLISNQETETEEGKKKAKTLFRVQKALALVAIAIDTARSVQAMLATGPAGIPLAIAAGVAGAVNFGLVASQSYDPEGGGGGGGGAAATGAISGAAPDRPDTSLEAADGTGVGAARDEERAAALPVRIDSASAEYLRDMLKVGIAANPLNPAQAYRAGQIISDAGKESGAGFLGSLRGSSRAGRK